MRRIALGAVLASALAVGCFNFDGDLAQCAATPGCIASSDGGGADGGVGQDAGGGTDGGGGMDAGGGDAGNPPPTWCIQGGEGYCATGGWCLCWVDMSAPFVQSVWGIGQTDLWMVEPQGTSPADAPPYQVDPSGTGMPTNMAEFVSVGTPALNGLWAADSNHVWTVGAGAVAFYWSSPSWTDEGPVASPNLNYDAVCGTAANDVWIVGTSDSTTQLAEADHWNGSALVASSPTGMDEVKACAQLAPGNVWAVTASGGIWNFSGSTWSARFDAGTPLVAVTAADSSDVWALGQTGVLAFFDGGSWALEPPATLPSGNYHGAWARGRSDLWVVGDNATAMHWNGATWSSYPYAPESSASTTLNSIWASPDGGPVWAVGGDPVSNQGVLWVLP